MKKTLLLLIVALSALLMSSVTFAGSPGGTLRIASAELRCDSARFAVVVNADIIESFQLDLYIDGERIYTEGILADSGVKIVDFNYPVLNRTAEITLYARIQYYGNERVEVRGIPDQLLFTRVIDCSNGEAPIEEINPEDGRFCFTPGQARAAVYAFNDANNETGISIWAVDASDEGEPVITLTAAQLREAANKPGKVVLLSQSLFNNIKFYQVRAEDGKISYQINVGPVGEVKIHECRFDSIPPMSVDVTSYEPGK